MPMYQIKTRVNSQTVNNDIECDSKDDLINFHNAVSTSEILEIKEYIYTSQDDSRLIDDTKSRYATVKVYFEHTLPIEIKIPKLKHNKDERDIINLIHTIYTNVQKVDVKITTKA